TISHPPCSDLGAAIEHTQAVPELTACTRLLIDRRGPVAVVLPYPAQLDLELINMTLNRQFQLLDNQTAQRIFRDCVCGMLPPFAMAYNLPVIIDADLMASDHCFVPAGCGTAMLKIAGPSFRG